MWGKLRWKLPFWLVSWLERRGNDVAFWLWGIGYAGKKAWERFKNLAEDAAVLCVGVILFFLLRSGGVDDTARDQALNGLYWAGAALALWLGVVFAWNLVFSYPRRHWNMKIALDEARGEIQLLEYQRDFYKNRERFQLRTAALLLRTELRDIQEKVELIEATVAGHSYWDGFAFPAGEWQKHRELVAQDLGLYAKVEQAYVKANRANEIILQRRTRSTARLIGRADEEDLPGVSERAGEAIAALDELLAELPQ